MSVLTFLFTDIEGSTRRWEADADAMRIALEAHNKVLRDAVAGNDGQVFNYTGDGMCAVFTDVFERLGHREPAATISAFATTPLTRASVPEINTTISHLREALGDEVYESLARTGESMTSAG